MPIVVIGNRLGKIAHFLLQVHDSLPMCWSGRLAARHATVIVVVLERLIAHIERTAARVCLMVEVHPPFRADGGDATDSAFLAIGDARSGRAPIIVAMMHHVRD